MVWKKSTDMSSAALQHDVGWLRREEEQSVGNEEVGVMSERTDNPHHAQTCTSCIHGCFRDIRDEL